MKSTPFVLLSILCMAAVPLICQASDDSFWKGDQALHEISECDACQEDLDTCEEIEAARDDLAGRGGYLGGFDNNPGNLDQGVTIAREGLYWEGVNLLSCAGRGCEHAARPGERFGALLVDMDGNFLQGWDINGIPAKLFPGGKVMGGQGGGFGGSALVIQDWNGQEVWRWEVVGGRWHHDHNRKNSWNGSYAPGMKPKDEGKTLVVANHRPGDDYDYPKSWLKEGHPAFDTSHISDLSIEGVDDALYIVDKKGRIKWQWFASHHYEQMGFDDAAKDGIRTVNVGRGSTTDWSHINNANWLGPNPWYDAGDDRFHPDNIIYDSRTNSIIGILAHDDKPGHWKKGDIIWRVGPHFGEGTPWADIGTIIGPHNAQMIPKGLPGAGNILVFDNGGWANYGELEHGGVQCGGDWQVALRDYSRIVEFDPITYQVVWEYTKKADTMEAWGKERKFYSSFISSVQRLPNGNTLICEGNQARFFEVNPEGEIVWEYIAGSLPGGPGVIGRALYRAYRYPVSWLPADMSSPGP